MKNWKICKIGKKKQETWTKFGKLEISWKIGTKIG